MSPRALLERAEHAAARALLRLPPAALRRLAGGRPVVVDGEVLLPEVQLLLALRRLLGADGLADAPPAEARRRLRRDCRVHAGRPTPVGAVTDLVVPGATGPRPARHYLPPGAAAGPLLVYFHGGGFVQGDLDTHDAACRLLCAEAGVHVLAVDYRLAPEHKFPAAVDDAVAAFAWARAHAARLGADPARVAVGGDSAGGNLAAVVALLAARAGTPAPCAQLLLYPVVDRGRPRPSIAAFADGFLLTRADIARFDEHYLGGVTVAEDDPRVTPLRAPDLAGLAPAVVVTAAFDPLRDEGEAYAARLAEAGVPTVRRRVGGMVHGFANLTGVSPAARAALVAVARDVRGLLAPRVAPGGDAGPVRSAAVLG